MGGVIAVIGATGFIGSASTEALRQAGWQTLPVSAPRLVSGARSLEALRREVDPNRAEDFARRHLAGVDVLVNAAGIAAATSIDLPSLLGANALLPLFLAEAARSAGLKRMVHISSAAVQGRRVLDESEHLDPQSPYALSKALGERLLRTEYGPQIIRYRPTSVQGPEREVTGSLMRLAESPAATVATPGTDPSPQTSAERVGEAITVLADSRQDPPVVVMHPWEGATTRSVLADLGGKDPRFVSRRTASAAVQAASFSARFSRHLAGHARRLEMMLFGQAQRESWLEGRMQTLDAHWLERIRLLSKAGALS